MAACDDTVTASGRQARPLILVAPRYEECQPCLKMPERLAPEETAATVFLDAILEAGGVPLIMPLTDDDAVIAQMVAMADGVSIPGGHDVSPRLWGDERPYDEKLLCPERDAFELKLIRAVLAAHKPLFTCCRGTQMLNVALGGSLCMDVPGMKPIDGMALWRHAPILSDPAHPVEIKAGSLLERSVGGFSLVQANSSHHCCIDRLGEGVELVARATDGVPEGIEVPSERFCLGVQWHPEYTWRKLETDRSLWKSFVEAAAATRGE